ncbi:MAG: N-acetyl-gamma-glutamyl-phosphate reductase [Peptococcaceae bacterium]|jgi:N-acetyl-gamma-glutamyl-phosphate reductase|nr:N-acetyl-gamma-glutamyl-phosphate reductase [Peptococcaceae bacterium]
MAEKIDVFVDGQSGTTGLQILQRLTKHPFVRVMKIPEQDRKDEEARRKLINEADIVILCLPDPAAVEAVALVAPDNHKTKIIDASTAHRVHPDWVYGLPELSGHMKEAITGATRVANPGCHATAFLLSVSPLVKAGFIPGDYPVSCHSITGYTGGGKPMINEYEGPDQKVLYPDYDAPREYALGQAHKHLPEMYRYSGLAYPPAFSPIVSNFPRGLAVFTPLAGRLLNRSDKKVSPQTLRDCLAAHYERSQMVRVMPYSGGDKCDGKGYVNVMACNDTDRAEIFILGSDERITLVCRLDNLGKGAGGAAIQNMNLMMGLPEDMGLIQ